MVPVADGANAHPRAASPPSPLPALSAVLDRAGAENFPVASRLLPPRIRGHLLALYTYARFVDEVGDDPAHPPSARLAALEAVEADLERLYRGEHPHLPALRALAPTVAACGLPRGPLARLLEANRRDQHVTRYATFDDLRGYCRLSADPVGELVLGVFGAATPARVELSDRVCTALQVLEHCQDVGEDAAHGRVYLPADDLAACGVTDAELTARSASPGLRAALARQVARARALLDEGAPLVGNLRGLARLAVAGYLAGGRATAAALEAVDHEVLAHLVTPAKLRLLAEWTRAAATGGRR